MTTLSYTGTIQGLREFLHTKSMDVVESKEYRNNPFKAGTLAYQDYEDFKNNHEKWHLEHQGDNYESSL